MEPIYFAVEFLSDNISFIVILPCINNNNNIAVICELIGQPHIFIPADSFLPKYDVIQLRTKQF